MTYYTPELTEFHPGFEFEEFNPTEDDIRESIWDKRICWKNDYEYLWDSDADYSNYRVKYLDEQDIKESGWILQGDSPSPFTGRPLKTFKITKEIGFNTGSDYFLETTDSDKIVITIFEYSSYGGGKEEMSFRIKNKNELQRLMTQLGI